jgi:ribose-phosphate pyrophosphokinase
MIYLNGTPLNVTLFPDNTSQVWKINPEFQCSQIVDIDWHFSHEGEFLHLAQLKNLLDYYGVEANLVLKYLPYGRQDKEVSNDTTFALRTFARLLNSLNFTSVMITDPHSNVALNLIRNSSAWYPEKTLHKLVSMLDCDVLCYPDKGAREKYSKIYPWVAVYGEKVRDQSTGHILSYSLNKEHWDVLDKKVLIVDDICDGGMTFVLLAKELFSQGATQVDLFVTHGIFSKGLKPLKEAGINRIFTQDGEASEVQNHITYRRL